MFTFSLFMITLVMRPISRINNSNQDGFWAYLDKNMTHLSTQLCEECSFISVQIVYRNLNWAWFEELILNIKGIFAARIYVCLRAEACWWKAPTITCFLSLIWSLMWFSLIFRIVEVMSPCSALILRCYFSSGCRHLEVRSMNLPKVIPVVPKIHFNLSGLLLDHLLRMPRPYFQRPYHSSYAVQVAHI